MWLYSCASHCGKKKRLQAPFAVMLMSGGINPDGNWISLKRFDFSILNRTWKETLLSGMRAWDDLGEFEAVLAKLNQNTKVFMPILM